ncbi:serine/threonine-protein kinase [Roseateles sp.]|uniref:serine/threonine-protein kinase n=1 Tax=Roseateles sp. TaxID=1971397 RepID=UPI00286BCFDF|nr:serine/threonine-protein kinase [Roseateles sp.]
MSPALNKNWTLLGPQLDELLGLNVAERAAWLQDLAGRDAANASQLSELLSLRDAASQDGFMHGVATLLPAQAQAGDQLGAWRLESLLGEGGMGTVWLARRTDGRFDGEAAIKLLRTGLFDAASQARFRREGAILARLHHPGIAPLLDAGVSERGQPYLVLEYVQGERIDAFCAAADLSVRARVTLFLQVLDAVAAAHAQLIIHRDLKPSNILVEAGGRVRLLDFGLARLQDSDAAQEPLTREGGLALTPEYAAPEQFQGGVLSMATDVFALGVVLYELLTGGRPSGLGAATPIEHLRAFDGEAFLLASGRAAAASLRGDLDNILAKALAFAAADRYVGATAMADDLRRYLADQPVTARPISGALRLRKFVRRNRLGVALGGLIALASAVGVASTVFQAQRAEAAASQARSDRDRALQELSHAESANELVAFLLTDGADKPFTSAELLDRAEAMVDTAFADDAEARARLLLMLASQRGELMQADQGEAVLRRAQAATAQAGKPSLAAGVQCMRGHIQTMRGDFEGAYALINPALITLERQGDLDLGLRINCLNLRTLLNIQSANAAAAVADAQAALALLGRPSAGQRVQAVEAQSALASALRQLGRRAESVAMFRQAIAALDAMGRGQTARSSTLWNNLGAALAASGQVRAGVLALERSQAIEQRISGAAGDATVLANLGDSFADEERYAAALALLQQAQVVARSMPGPRVMGEIQLRLAAALLGLGRLDEAGAALADASALLGSLLKPGHPSLGTVALTAGKLRLAQGDAAGARVLIEQAAAIYAAASNDHPGRFRAQVALARVLQAQGQAEAAQQIAGQALMLARHFSTGFASSEYLGSALLLQAELLMAAGQRGQAAKLAADAVAHLRATVDASAPLLKRAEALALAT